MTLIAILDDRATNRQIFSRLAASLEAGIRVEAFGDPLAALDWLDANPPDLVVADYKMPHIDGAEFTRRLRQSVHGQDVPLIMVTAYDDREDKLRALEAGATDFLQTPVDHQEFIGRARNLLALRRHQQQAKQRTLWLEQALATSEAIRRDLGPPMPPPGQPPLDRILDLVPLAISLTDRAGSQIYVNARHTALVGHPAEATADPEHARRHRELDRQVRATATAIPCFEEAIADPAGRPRVLLTSKAPLLDAGGALIGVLTSSYERPDDQGGPRPEADPGDDRLTGLPPLERLREAIADGLAGGAAGLAVHVIGLDGFKRVNDTRGPAAGDELLRGVARRLRQFARPGDVVARGRGDQFAVLQRQDPDEIAAVALADRLRRAFEAPFEIGGEPITITASVGVAVFPPHGATPSELLRAAQRAMREAKAGGRNLARLAANAATSAPARGAADGHPQGQFRLDADRRDQRGVSP